MLDYSSLKYGNEINDILFKGYNLILDNFSSAGSDDHNDMSVIGVTLVRSTDPVTWESRRV